MLLLLLLPFLVHLLGLGARDVPKDTKYVIKKITSCPDVGYYFRREASPNSLQPGPCFLCFCQDDGTAICWKRENKRCDVSSYQHRDIGKRETRVRRSPFGLGDIFFRDAARDIFNKNTPQTCKPFETSFSEGCPPADWCVGCSVCDCDAHGHWDCHILSFCPDKNDKSIIRTSKTPLKKPSKTEAKTSKATKALTKQPKKTTITTKSPKPVKPNKVQNKTAPRRLNRQAKNTNALKTKSQQMRNNNIKKNNMNASPKPLIIKKNVATRNPVILKTTKNHIKLNATDREFITQEVVKRVVTVMQRMLNRSQIINNQLLSILPSPKTIQKRSMDKKKPQNFRKNVKKYRPPTSIKSRYRTPWSPKKNPGADQTRPKRSGHHKVQRKNERYKRNILGYVTETHQIRNASNTETHVISENEVRNKSTTVDNYYKYALVTHIPTNDTNLKKNEESYHFIYIDGFNDTNRRQISPEKVKQRTTFMAKKYQSSQKFNTSILYEVTTNDMQNHDLKIFTQNSREFDLLNYRKANITLKPINNVKVILTNNFMTNKTKDNHEDASERQVRPHPKKYNSSKIVNTLNNKRKMLNISNPSMASNIEKSFKTQVYKKVVDIQNVLKRLLNEFHSNKTKLMKPKRTRFNIFKYVKKFFKNIFWKRNTKVELLHNSAYEKKKLKSHIIHVVCEVFNNCHVKKGVNKLIEPKISELHFETNKILRIIKIIKGLLHIIDLPSTLHNETGKIYFKDDISKLNYILKNQYNMSEKVLTQNQITQINYLKNNVELFIQSVGKFANILNEIIAMLTNKHAHNNADVRNRRNTKNDYFPNVTRNYTVTKDFDKLNDLLKKYRLVQNTFIKKMYDVLSKFEKSQNNSSMRKVSYEHNDAVNTNVRTENISRNIIKNLRKLKNLAQMLNSNQRKKRDVMREDDTIEYLLTLMEFMLKQTHPLNAAPVNDGIDLLIEAIKNAPDIKPIEKKVIKTVPSNVGRNSITDAPSIYFNTPQDESVLESNKDSAEDNVNVTLDPDGTRPKDSEQDKEYKNDETEKNMSPYNTESIFYDGNYPTAQNPNEVIDTTLSYQSDKISDTEESINGGKIENEIKNEKVKKFDIFAGDIEDDDSDMEVTSHASDIVRSINEAESAVESTTVRAVAETTEFKLPAVRLRQYNVKNKDISESSSGGNDKHVALDWLDERYEQDLTEAMEAKEIKTNPENITKTKTTSRTYTSSDIPILQKHADNISSMTKELSVEEKSKQSKLNTEEVMYKKQMDLLNSLDYGTEKSELEDSELKEEKEEAFMSYYN